ncbi:MAG: secretin and TonB N-terminal domain-containing protein [Candidatus Omnitrophota bacterium]
MKRFIFILILLSLFFGLQNFAFSQGDLSGFDREQACAIAQEIAQEKAFEQEQDGAQTSYTSAKNYTLGSDRKVEILKEAQRRADLDKKVIQQKRVLDVEKAWLVDEPGVTTTYTLERKTSSLLKEKAQIKIVSIDFSDAQLKKVFEYLSDASGINIIFDEAAVNRAGSISIHVKNVTVIKALEMIIRTKGLGYRFEEDYIWITSKDGIKNENMVTKIFSLSQGLATFTTFTTFDTVTVKALRSDGRIVMPGEENGEDYRGNGKGVNTYEGVKIGGSGGVDGKLSLTVKDVLKEIIPWPEGSSIFLDHRTSTLIVRNTPTNLSMIDQALEVLDVAPPQVMIEARFVEIGDDDLFSLGLKLSSEVSATGAKQPNSYPFNRNESNKLVSPFPAANAEDFSFGTLDFSQFQAVLSAIEQNDSSNTLSSPKITTISGQEAIIKIVKEYRYPTKYDLQSFDIVVNGESRTQYLSVPADFKTRDIGIILKVTPNIGTDGKTINLTLVPEVSEFDITADMYNYGTADNPYLQPFFSVRNCTASIVVNNNDTVVMGGLMREVEENTIDRVPILGSLPLIGKLFSRKYENKQKRNLLIFVTARVMAPTGETVQSAKNVR